LTPIISICLIVVTTQTGRTSKRMSGHRGEGWAQK
jgi:hypothetical protein